MLTVKHKAFCEPEGAYKGVKSALDDLNEFIRSVEIVNQTKVTVISITQSGGGKVSNDTDIRYTRWLHLYYTEGT